MIWRECGYTNDRQVQSTCNNYSVSISKANTFLMEVRKLVQNLKISVTKTIPLLYILSLSLWELVTFHVTGIVKFIGIIHKLTFCLPTTSLCALYYSLVHLYLIYCVSMSGSTSHSKFNCIVTLHKKGCWNHIQGFIQFLI